MTPLIPVVIYTPPQPAAAINEQRLVRSNGSVEIADLGPRAEHPSVLTLSIAYSVAPDAPVYGEPDRPDGIDFSLAAGLTPAPRGAFADRLDAVDLSDDD